MTESEILFYDGNQPKNVFKAILHNFAIFSKKNEEKPLNVFKVTRMITTWLKNNS